jgi:hypothetical protein
MLNKAVLRSDSPGYQIIRKRLGKQGMRFETAALHHLYFIVRV